MPASCRSSFTTRLFVALGIFISTSGLAVTLPGQQAIAQDLPPLPIQFNPDNLINPGRPGGRRRGGGSRGSCQAERPLSAIAYADSRSSSELGVTRTDEIVGSLTTQANPTLWFYMPEPVNGETATQLILKSSNDELLFEGQLSGETDSSGIIGVPLTVSLDPGEAYQWFLTLECDESESTTVNGWLERRTTSADLTRTFTQANARNRVALYANYGYLQDALSELAALKLANPEDEAIDQEWRSFLTALDLTDLATESLLNCCQLDNAEGSPDEETDNVAPDPVRPTETEPEEEPDNRTILQRARDRG